MELSPGLIVTESLSSKKISRSLYSQILGLLVSELDLGCIIQQEIYKLDLGDRILKVQAMLVMLCLLDMDKQHSNGKYI